MDSYQAALQKLKAQRQQQLGEVQQQTDENMPMFQQDRNRTALMAEQSKRKIRDLMARLNTVGGGQQANEEIGNELDYRNDITNSYDKEKAFKNAQATKMQNLNNQFNAAESEALASYQEQQAVANRSSSSSKEAATNELNSVYVALNQAIDNRAGEQFLRDNRDEIIARFGMKAYDDMLSRVNAEGMNTNKRLVAANINTTPQQYEGYNIYS